MRRTLTQVFFINMTLLCFVHLRWVVDTFFFLISKYYFKRKKILSGKSKDYLRCLPLSGQNVKEQWHVWSIFRHGIVCAESTLSTPQKFKISFSKGIHQLNVTAEGKQFFPPPLPKLRPTIEFLPVNDSSVYRFQFLYNSKFLLSSSGDVKNLPLKNSFELTWWGLKSWRLTTLKWHQDVCVWENRLIGMVTKYEVSWSWGWGNAQFFLQIFTRWIKHIFWELFHLICILFY